MRLGGGGMASHQIRAEATDLRAWGKKAGRDHQHSPGRGAVEARVHLQLHLNRLVYQIPIIQAQSVTGRGEVSTLGGRGGLVRAR